MKVCVQGLWHVGPVTAACLASLGQDVVGLDFDAKTVDGLNRCVTPVSEPGLEELIKRGLDSGNLRFSSSAEEATEEIDILWVAYDTPVDDEDHADVDFVFRQIERALAYLPVGTMVLISSQLPVGSIRRLERIAASKFSDRRLRFACSPENLRLGKAIEVFLNADRIVAGVRPDNGTARLEPLLRTITPRIEWMSVESAEMTKHAINAFLATSVSFVNEIASLCELSGADAKEVERGLKSESRIGPKAYLSPGAAFGGGTLARDVAFLNRVGAERDLVTPLLSAIRPSNDRHRKWVMRKLQALFPDLANTAVAVWGLTYKPGTDTLRRSMAVELCDWLLQQGVGVRVHDPAVKDLPANWSGRLRRYLDPVAAVEGAQVLVIATEWPLYREIPAERVLAGSHGLTVLDANRFVAGYAGLAGLRYVAVGTPDEVL